MKPEIKAFIFDVYGTLFDVHSVKEKCDDIFPGKGLSISQSWRNKQLNYFFLRQLMGRYENFEVVTREALRYAIAQNHEDWTAEIEDKLITAYSELALYQEVKKVLAELKNKKAIILSNGTNHMLQSVVKNAGINHFFHSILSIDDVKQYKPTAAAYNYALIQLGFQREEVLFMSSNGWDISGAKNFGFHTAWINRSNAPSEKLGLAPDSIYEDITGILEWKSQE